MDMLLCSRYIMRHPCVLNVDYDEETQHLLISYAIQSDVDRVLKEYVGRCIKELSIVGDEVNELIVPEGVERVLCSGVGLKRVWLPDSCKVAYLEKNKLRNIELPEGIEVASLRKNLLELIVFRGDSGNPTALEELDIKCNRLIKLDFIPPPSLYLLDLRGNQFLVDIGEGVRCALNTLEDGYI